VGLYRQKQYQNRANPQNIWSAGEDAVENSSGKDFALYTDILPGVSSQRKLVLAKRFGTNRSIFLAEQPVIRYSTTHSLAASADLEVALASMGWRIKGCLLREIWSHYQPVPGCRVTSCSISGTTPFPKRLPLPQGPICLLKLKLTACGEGKISKHPWDEFT